MTAASPPPPSVLEDIEKWFFGYPCLWFDRKLWSSSNLRVEARME